MGIQRKILKAVNHKPYQVNGALRSSKAEYVRSDYQQP